MFNMDAEAQLLKYTPFRLDDLILQVNVALIKQDWLDRFATADLLDVVEDRNYITNAPRGFLYFGG